LSTTAIAAVIASPTTRSAQVQPSQAPDGGEDSDGPRMAKLRAVLRDESLMAHVHAIVEQWQPLSDEQRDTLAALLGRAAHRSNGYATNA
jgi:hypothetical protein